MKNTTLAGSLFALAAALFTATYVVGPRLPAAPADAVLKVLANSKPTDWKPKDFGSRGRNCTYQAAGRSITIYQVAKPSELVEVRLAELNTTLKVRSDGTGGTVRGTMPQQDLSLSGYFRDLGNGLLWHEVRPMSEPEEADVLRYTNGLRNLCAARFLTKNY